MLNKPKNGVFENFKLMHQVINLFHTKKNLLGHVERGHKPQIWEATCGHNLLWLNPPTIG